VERDLLIEGIRFLTLDESSLIHAEAVVTNDI